MLKETLKLISDAMESMQIPYEYAEWASAELPSPFFVGEYQEIEPLNESGLQENLFILTGTSRNTWAELEDAKEKIAAYFNKVSGRTVITASGAAVAVFYSNGLVVPTGDAELKRIQINLEVKEWSVK